MDNNIKNIRPASPHKVIASSGKNTEDKEQEDHERKKSQRLEVKDKAEVSEGSLERTARHAMRAQSVGISPNELNRLAKLAEKGTTIPEDVDTFENRIAADLGFDLPEE